MFTKEQLSEEFKKFRAYTHVEENKFLETALLGFDYLGLEHQQLKRTFENLNTPDYSDLNRHGKRDISLPLMLKLMLDIHISSSDNFEEKNLLRGISETLAQIYINPLHNLNNVTIDQLTTNIIQWLESYSPSNLSSDLVKKQLCQAIFLTITCLMFKCQSLNFLERGVFSPTQDNLSKLSRILEIINQKNMRLNDTDDGFLNNYFRQFNSLSNDTMQALEQISTLSSSFQTQLNRFFEVKSQLEKIQSLSAALNRNQNLYRPLYCHELMENHPELTATLSSLISSDEYDELTSCCEKTKQNSYTNSTKQYASSIFSFSNAMYRNFSPQIVQETLNYYLETHDSRAKKLLKQYCEKAIETLQTELNQEINNPFKELDAADIEQLKTVNESTLHWATRYQTMYREIQDFKQTHLDIKEYIQQKDSLFEHVIDFIKRFVTLFSQPSLSKKIHMLKTQQTELDAVIQSFENEMERNPMMSRLPSLQVGTAQTTNFQNLQTKISLFKESDTFREYSQNTHSRS